MPNNILITPGSASIEFSGSAASTIKLQVEPSGTISFYGNSGSLFSISDNFSGSLLSVTDISGLPILEVTSDDKVVMGTFGTNALVVTGSNVGIGTATPSTKLSVVGAVSASSLTGSLNYNNLANIPKKTIQTFTSLDNNPPATNFATLDTRNSIAVLDFDDTTDEAAVFVGIIPANTILTSGISTVIHWSATTATSGSCVWGVQFEKTTNQDIDSDSFDTAVTGSTTTSATSGIINETTIISTNLDSLASGNLFRLKIYRDADATADTMVGDAELVAVELKEN
jgi:hypothetical protein